MQVAKTETSRTMGGTWVISWFRPEVEVTRASTAENDGPLLSKRSEDVAHRAGTEGGEIAR